jgi:hypothetical protein
MLISNLLKKLGKKSDEKSYQNESIEVYVLFHLSVLCTKVLHIYFLLLFKRFKISIKFCVF